MGGVGLASAVKRVLARAQQYSRAVWSRDLASLGGSASLWTRIARIVTWSVRGVFVNKLSLQAAALAYYTLFSIVPVLVVALWALKLLNLIPYLTPDLPEGSALSTMEHADHTGNEMLREAIRGILTAVQRAGRLHTGIVGLAALAYGVIKQIHHIEVALDTIAGASERPPKYWRILAYPALLALPPALLVISGLLRGLSRLPVGETFARRISWLLAVVPFLKSALGVVVGLSIVCLALAIFYASAARARIALWSTLVGAAIGAILLAAVLWLFARLQIGASHVGALESGMAAVPVFLLWSFSSWMVVLIGAQIAVAHELDGILIHGASTWHLEPYDEQVAGVQIIVETTRRALSAHDDGATVNELARQLRLLPENVRAVAGRLVAAGLLRRTDAGRFRLACDPDRTSLRDVVAATIGRPVDDVAATPRLRTGPTLHELVERETAH